MKETITSFVGLDVHKDSIAVAVAEAGRQAPRRTGNAMRGHDEGNPRKFYVGIHCDDPRS